MIVYLRGEVTWTQTRGIYTDEHCEALIRWNSGRYLRGAEKSTEPRRDSEAPRKMALPLNRPACSPRASEQVTGPELHTKFKTHKWAVLIGAETLIGKQGLLHWNFHKFSSNFTLCRLLHLSMIPRHKKLSCKKLCFLLPHELLALTLVPRSEKRTKKQSAT